MAQPSATRSMWPRSSTRKPSVFATTTTPRHQGSFLRLLKPLPTNQRSAPAQLSTTHSNAAPTFFWGRTYPRRHALLQLKWMMLCGKLTHDASEQTSSTQKAHGNARKTQPFTATLWALKPAQEGGAIATQRVEQRLSTPSPTPSHK